jgi:hypothetical protein
METLEIRSKQGATTEALSLVLISPAIFEHTRAGAGIATTSNTAFFPHIG